MLCDSTVQLLPVRVCSQLYYSETNKTELTVAAAELDVSTTHIVGDAR